MTNFDSFLKEQLKDDEFKKEYDALEEEYQAEKQRFESSNRQAKKTR